MDWPSKRTDDLKMFFLYVEREEGTGYFVSFICLYGSFGLFGLA
jgi:hypothetical protein